MINTSWLIESLKFKHRVLEEDFVVKPTEGNLSSNSTKMMYSDINTRASGAGFALYQRSQSQLGGDVGNVFKRSDSTSEGARQEIKFKSLLFKNMIFYFPKGSNLKKYRIAVMEHSGSILPTLDNIKKLDSRSKRSMFGVYRDGIRKSEYEELTKYSINVVSTRWVDFCIERKYLLKDPTAEKMYQLLAFPIKTPVEEFKGIQIKIKGFDVQKLKSLKETAAIMGFDIAEKTQDAKIVVLEKKKFKEVAAGKDPKFEGKVLKKESWLFELIMKGVFSEADKKLILGE